MNKRDIALFLLVFASVLLSADRRSENPPLAGFTLYQGEYLSPIENVYALSRAPFQIELSLEDVRYVYLNFSRNDELYRAVREGRDFQEILGFGGTGMAEYYGNPDRKIILNDGGWHVWKTDGKGDNRFDKTFPKKDYTLAIRTVENIHEMSPSGAVPVDLEELGRLYCVICDVTPGDFWDYQLNEVQAFIVQFE